MLLTTSDLLIHLNSLWETCQSAIDVFSSVVLVSLSHNLYLSFIVAFVINVVVPVLCETVKYIAIVNVRK